MELTKRKLELVERFNAQTSLVDIEPSFNAAPSQLVPAITYKNGERVLRGLKWGFVPVWAKDTKSAPINARPETAATIAEIKAHTE